MDSSLYVVCKNNNLTDIIKLLIQNGATINAKTGDGRTALQNVCQFYSNDQLVMNIVRLLVERGGILWGKAYIDYLCKRNLAKCSTALIHPLKQIRQKSPGHWKITLGLMGLGALFRNRTDLYKIAENPKVYNKLHFKMYYCTAIYKFYF